MSLSAEQYVEAERHLREWMAGRRDASSVAGKMPALLAELDRLQATADRRGELLRRASSALADLRFNNGPAQRQEAHDIVAAIVAELAGEGDGRG